MSSLTELTRFLLGFFLLFMLLMIITGIILAVFWIWMIIDCAKREFKNVRLHSLK